MNRILIFVGSGISYDTGLLNTDQITNKIFDDNWYKHTDQTFNPGLPPSVHLQRENIVPRLKEFLKRVKEISDPYFESRIKRKSNYEDLYFICQQIKDDCYREIHNPIMVQFIEYINKNITDLFVHSSKKYEKIYLRELSSYSCDFIKCAVGHITFTDNDPIGLDIIKELIDKFEYVDIATLNHDLLIEKLLKEINFNDGFGEIDGELRYFSPQDFKNESIKINLFKLHGSINWYIFREEIDTVTIDRYGIPTIKDIHHCKNESGKNIFLLDAIPLILTGSYNKLYSYNFGIFHKIHNEFEDCLWKHKRIIMSGYGWNDKGINHRILEWLSSSLANKLILLHRNPDEDIKLKSISPMWHRYDDLVAEGRLIPIKKWLSEITFNEIKDYVTE